MFYSPFPPNGGTDMEVLACFRPGFFFCPRILVLYSCNAFLCLSLRRIATCCTDPQRAAYPRKGSFLNLGSNLCAPTSYYFHVNGSIGIVQKINFEIRPDLGCTTLKSSRKVVLDNPSVCLSVWVSVCLAVAFPASSHRRKVQPIELKL